MAVHIQIIVDNDGSVVVQKEAGSDDVYGRLKEIIARWKIQADEPCSIGRKCNILTQWIGEIENLL